MTSPASPAETRAFILERLTGATGEPGRVLATARRLADGIAETLPAILGDLMASPLEVEAGDVSLTRMADAMALAPNQPAALVSFAGQSEPAVIAADTAAMSLMINGLFGAGPDAPAVAFERALSALELDAASLLLGGLAEAFNESAEAQLRMTLPPGPILTGAERAKIALRDGPAVRIAIALKAPGGAGLITVTLSERALAKPAAVEREHSSGEWSARFGDEIKRSTISLDAVVPIGAMTLGEIASWRPGTLVELPQEARSNTKLAARDRTLFVCEFGRLGQSYTVRVDRPFDAGQDLIADLLGIHP